MSQADGVPEDLNGGLNGVRRPSLVSRARTVIRREVELDLVYISYHGILENLGLR